ncbi:MAG: endonuclease/exonuclease/phosphatase family protein [Wenzhouxiangellaceae bacterium]|nr:endonuclease/exonuclease/phosphatase family protein [Wenzhouxiangellaceae bacterium]
MTSRDPSLLRLLSFNIQAGTTTARYRQYVTRSWRQVLPNNQRVANLDAISELVAPYDVVGLQEVDCGSLRSGFVNQAKYLATHAGFPWWTHQGNRKVGVIAHAGNGVLSRFRPDAVDEHRLPGAIPGRGALEMKFGEGDDALHIVVLHLALGRRARFQQLRYVAHLVERHRHVVVMGDLNSAPDSREIDEFRERAGLQFPGEPPATFPSWRPQRSIDHILVSPTLEPVEVRALSSQLSDHLPLAVTLRLPDGLSLQRHPHRHEQQEGAEQAGQAG